MLKKYKEVILIILGTLLIFSSVILICYDRFSLIKDEVFTNIELEKYNENHKEVLDEESVPSDVIDVSTDVVDEEEVPVNDNPPVTNYLGFLKIDAINLNVGFYSKNSKNNTVSKGIQIISISDYPDVVNGNLIMASHSGSSSISYFKNLYKLTIGDVASVYYGNYIYSYRIIEIFNIQKTGKYSVKTYPDKTTLTLITCTKNSKTEQTIYILDLFNKVKNVGGGNG